MKTTFEPDALCWRVSVNDDSILVAPFSGDTHVPVPEGSISKLIKRIKKQYNLGDGDLIPFLRKKSDGNIVRLTKDLCD